MKIHVEQVGVSGIKLSQRYQPQELDLNSEVIKFTEPIDISASVTKAINNLSVQLEIAATMRLVCSRCLREFPLPFKKQARLNLPIAGRQIINLTDNLREEIIFSFPLKPLCKPGCRGLCFACGEDLNQGKCGCQP